MKNVLQFWVWYFIGTLSLSLFSEGQAAEGDSTAILAVYPKVKYSRELVPQVLSQIFQLSK